MAADHSIGTWTDERLQNEAMNVSAGLLDTVAEVDGQVSTSVDRLQDTPVAGQLLGITPAPARLHLAVPAHPVSGITLDRSEMFVCHAIYRRD
jgi:hypothetical protein